MANPSISFNGAPTFTLTSGIFINSTLPGSTFGALLQYGQTLHEGLVSDITPVLFLGRAGAAIEVGQARFNAAQFSYDLPWLVLHYNGTMHPVVDIKTDIMGIDQDQHNGGLCRYRDAEGNDWTGALFLTQDSFEKKVGGGIVVTATWMEVR